MQQPANESSTSDILKSITNNDLEPLTVNMFDDITDEVILGLCFDVHRAVKLGIFFLDEPKEDEKKYEIVDEIGLDVFGQVPLKKQIECVCPNCQRSLAASRFAPHLEKCMGMGRNSSRIASKRIANSGKTESDVDDYDNDSDWNYSSDRKSSKKKRDKNSPRRAKSKGKNGDTLSGSSASSDGNSVFTNYETMSIEERKALLMQMCGVISEHTKKMCTRSHRCPQHTDEQRRSVRHFLLGRQGDRKKGVVYTRNISQFISSLPDTTDDVQIDVDTLEEGDSQILRLWESGNSANASPADSTSTNNGASSSKKKEKKLHSNRHSCNSKKSRVRPSQGSVGSNSSQGSTGPSSFEII